MGFRIDKYYLKVRDQSVILPGGNERQLGRGAKVLHTQRQEDEKYGPFLKEHGACSEVLESGTKICT